MFKYWDKVRVTEGFYEWIVWTVIRISLEEYLSNVAYEASTFDDYSATRLEWVFTVSLRDVADGPLWHRLIHASILEKIED